MAKRYSRNMEIVDLKYFPSHMKRIAMGIEYNGSFFHGFQAQAEGVITVQGALEQSLTAICGEPISLVCAGRTDMGVHATNQVVHFDTTAIRPERAWLRGANTTLPQGVSIRWATEVSPLFHARFNAHSRTYRYVIHNAKTPSALLERAVTWDRHRLDVNAMREGSRHLLGEHDFSAFRGTGCQARTPIRRIDKIDISTQRDFIVIEVQATAFLYHMVRNIVGVLTAVAAGGREPLWVKEVLESKNRCCAGVTAPAAGLYLVAVGYDPSFRIPHLEKGPYFIESLM